MHWLKFLYRTSCKWIFRVFILTIIVKTTSHFSFNPYKPKAYFLWDTCKQCRPRPQYAASNQGIYCLLTEYSNSMYFESIRKIPPNIPNIWNRLVLSREIGNFIRLKWGWKSSKLFQAFQYCRCIMLGPIIIMWKWTGAHKTGKLKAKVQHTKTTAA